MKEPVCWVCPGFGRAHLSYPFRTHSEGRACRVRRATFDYPSCFIGHRGFSPSPTLPARGEGESISPRMRGDVKGAALLRLWRDLLVRSAFRRDALVASATQRLIIHPASAGTTSVPLRIACQVLLWRDALVASVVSGWMNKRNSADLTSRSLRGVDLTNRSLREADPINVLFALARS
jgi:hypothetical protein